jgi:hypothetical protein
MVPQCLENNGTDPVLYRKEMKWLKVGSQWFQSPTKLFVGTQKEMVQSQSKNFDKFQGRCPVGEGLNF